MTFERAALVGPIALVYHGINRTKIRPGDVVVITGPGPIGFMAAQITRLMGGTPLLTGLAVDAERLLLAKELGIKGVNAEEEDLSALIKTITHGRGADVVIETSGAPIIQDNINFLKNGGELMLIGYNSKPQLINALDLVMGELTIKGSSGYNWETWAKGYAILESTSIPFERLVTHRFAFSEIIRGFQAVKQRKALKVLIEHDEQILCYAGGYLHLTRRG
jgi:L-iditol 2-dehydrogenase